MSFTVLRPPVPTTDEDGVAIFLVPLANNAGCAKVLPEDYNGIASQGRSLNWVWNCGAVRVPDNRTNTKHVARLILDPEGDVRVGYLDGNPFNLRRDNLIARNIKRHRREPQKRTHARPFSPPFA